MPRYTAKQRSSCPKGKVRSTRDHKHRCVIQRSRAICAKQGKNYHPITHRCQKACAHNRELVARKRGSGYQCNHKCADGQERGPRTCRLKCNKGYARAPRSNGRGTRCKKVRR